MLTQRQQQVLDFLHSQLSRSGVMPSTREIQHHFRFASQTAALNHLRALERKGAIRRLPGKARAVSLPSLLNRPTAVDIPLYGQIAAGMPQATDPLPESTLAVDTATLGLPHGSRCFALRIRGDSMIDAHILDGDTAVLELAEPRHGDIVAALIDGETTLKRYLLHHGSPFLRAENTAYPDLIPARELIVQGVLIGLLRGRAGIPRSRS